MKRISSIPLFFGALVSVAACNGVLGNDPGELVSDDGGDGVDASAITSDATMQGTEEQQQADAMPPTPDSGATCSTCSLPRATTMCVDGACAVAACDPGYADCNGKPEDGCEIDLSQSKSCGACNAICAAAAPNCAPVGPTFECTTGCPADAPLLCGTQCVDTETSVDHCGDCNTACAAIAHATVTCAASKCAFACKATYHACGSTCASDTDPTACGASCVVCPGTACVAGKCQAAPPVDAGSTSDSGNTSDSGGSGATDSGADAGQ